MGGAGIAILIFFLSKNKPETSANVKASEASCPLVWAPSLLRVYPDPVCHSLAQLHTAQGKVQTALIPPPSGIFLLLFCPAVTDSAYLRFPYTSWSSHLCCRGTASPRALCLSLPFIPTSFAILTMVGLPRGLAQSCHAQTLRMGNRSCVFIPSWETMTDRQEPTLIATKDGRTALLTSPLVLRISPSVLYR